jgi:CheY-like chemotaxis protein
MREKHLTGMSLLVADDHVDGAELLQMLLLASGAADVRVVHTGDSALELLETFRPDVLLLDITLPDMDGYELLPRIRAIAGMEKVPAVAVTGHTNERDRASAARAGFAVHVIKPIDTEALLHVVAELGRPAPPAPRSEALTELDGLLERKGVVEVLRCLNARSDYRFTALYQYDGATLRSLALVDRLEPTTTKGGDVPIETSFCWMVQRDRASFSTADGSADLRVTGLPLRKDIKAYCGALVRSADGKPFGSLCHFDHDQRSIPEAELSLLEQFAPALARVVSADVF